MNTDESASSEPATELPEPITAEEAKFFFDESPDVFVITELSSGRVIKANAAERSVLGVDFWKAASFLELIHQDDRANAIEAMKLLHSGQTATAEHRCLTKDGTYVWMEFRGVPVPEQNRIYAVGRDISQRKEAELRSSQLSSIVESACEAIVRVDLNDRITGWNHGAELLFRYSWAEVDGMPLSFLFRDSLGNSLRHCMENGVEREFVCKGKDDREVLTSIMISDVFDEKGSRVAYAMFARNIQHRKELDKRVREFYSAVSHELRTPLTSIKGALGMIAGGLIEPTSEEAHELIEIANESAERLIKLVNDILDVRRIDAGRLDLVRRPTRPASIVQRAVKETSLVAAKAKVEIEVALEPNLPELYVSEHRIVQVVTSLISNAVKFCPDGKLIIIRVEATENGLRFSVTDRGAGIPAERAEQLFCKFQQLDSSDSRKHDGTGLGLAISKSLVEEHGGTIGYFNSYPGCTFWFELPILPASTASPARTASAVADSDRL
ncbi:MAG: PAS domain-containing sensor histidine kinase [Candidatus Obscuribacterales bacterium]|nr:PAS domain-containing sensor histidine kinase [Candidatus Obscuribacterales bacterium]